MDSFISAKKPNRLVYFKLKNEQTSTPVSELKWNSYPAFPENFDWVFTYKIHFKCTFDSKLQYFQYKIDHRILGTNGLVSKYEDISPLCTFCKHNMETISHLLWNCKYVSDIWLYVKMLLEIELNEWSVLFGLKCRENEKLFNFIILIAKHYIFSCKMQQIKPHTGELIKKIKYYYIIEESIYRRKNCLTNFAQRWKCVNHVI